MPPILTFAIPLLAAFLGTFCYNRGSSILPSPVTQLLSSYNQSVPPHYASWNTWFHPSRTVTTEKPKGWNQHYYLGGNGPWVEMIDDENLNLGSIHPPEGCFVDQVHMVWFLRLKLEATPDCTYDLTYRRCRAMQKDIQLNQSDIVGQDNFTITSPTGRGLNNHV